MKKRADIAPETQKAEESRGSLRPATRKSVYIYIATLFTVVLLFIFLSYLIQRRNDTEIHSLHEKNLAAQQNIEDLQNQNLQLRGENESYKSLIAELQAEVSRLEQEVQDLKQQWQDEVRSIRESDRAAYEDLLDKYNALVEKYNIKGEVK